MNTRVALFAASLAASGALTVGLVLAGFAPSAPAPVASTVTAAPATAAPPAPITQIDTVYVAPQATPAIVTVQKVVTGRSRGDDGGHDGPGDH